MELRLCQYLRNRPRTFDLRWRFHCKQTFYSDQGEGILLNLSKLRKFNFILTLCSVLFSGNLHQVVLGFSLLAFLHTLHNNNASFVIYHLALALMSPLEISGRTKHFKPNIRSEYCSHLHWMIFFIKPLLELCVILW